MNLGLDTTQKQSMDNDFNDNFFPIPWKPLLREQDRPELLNAELYASFTIPATTIKMPWVLELEYNTGYIVKIFLEDCEDLHHLTAAYGPNQTVGFALRGKPLENGKDYHISKKEQR